MNWLWTSSMFITYLYLDTSRSAWTVERSTVSACRFSMENEDCIVFISGLLWNWGWSLNCRGESSIIACINYRGTPQYNLWTCSYILRAPTPFRKDRKCSIISLISLWEGTMRPSLQVTKSFKLQDTGHNNVLMCRPYLWTSMLTALWVAFLWSRGCLFWGWLHSKFIWSFGSGRGYLRRDILHLKLKECESDKHFSQYISFTNLGYDFNHSS